MGGTPTYELLASTTDQEAGVRPLSPASTHWTQRVLPLVTILQTLVIFLLVWLSASQRCCNSPSTQTLYSPAPQEAMQEKLIKFQTGFDPDLTPFQGRPSPEGDALWNGLYDMAFTTKIPREQAALMLNETMPLQSEEEGSRMVWIDVFHQLHCLNTVRKALFPDIYPMINMTVPQDFAHVDHCVDSLRQSIMCAVDVAPIVFQWKPAAKAYKARGDVLHVCRNFEGIRDWANEKRTVNDIQWQSFVEDDLHA